MINQVVEFVVRKEIRTMLDRDDAYCVRKDRPVIWLQRVCVYILEKLGAKSQITDIAYTRHTIDTASFIEKLFAQKHEIVKCTGKPPTRLLIGAEDFADMMDSVLLDQEFTFRATYGYERKMMGLDVTVIPWMRGILVMP